jgi:hypothetical protein
MIQVILKDNTKLRFTKHIEGINLKDIAYQKKLTKDEIKKIPKIKNGKLIMISNTENEKKAKQLQKKKSEIEQKIKEQIRSDAIDKLLKDGKIKSSDLKLIK